MRDWELALSIDRGGGLPVFAQIARAVSEDVRRGRLRPGQPLPGSRRLAVQLGVHRNSVLAAYSALEAEGWITTQAARGTFVSLALPEPTPRRFAARAVPREQVPARTGFDLGPAIEMFRAQPALPAGTLALAGGVPDVRLVPAAPLARAYRRALRSHGRSVLGYSDSGGHARLRAALAGMLSATRGLAADPSSLLVTRGSQMALTLVARALVAPGDVVAVEDPGYRPAWEALRSAGARLVPLPVDDSGLKVERLRALMTRARVRAMYTTPHHQYPTTVTLAAGRRLELLELARTARMAIIEDDYDHEFHYDGRPVLPLASADRAGVVVYIGTLSKVLAPGLRIGYAVAPTPLVERLTAIRSTLDLQGDHLLELAVAELLEDGEVQRHVRRARRIYQERRDTLARLLARALGSALTFTAPTGGMALWGSVDPAIDLDAWERRALERGVAFQPGRRFAFDRRALPRMRLGFAALTAEELREAVRRLAASLS